MDMYLSSVLFWVHVWMETWMERWMVRELGHGWLQSDVVDVGDHENGPKNNQGGAVDDGTMRKYFLEEDVVFPRWT